MSPAAELLGELRRRGVELRAAGDRLRFRPAASVPPDLRARMVACKLELLALLTRPEKSTAQPSHAAPTFIYSPAPTFGQVCTGWRPVDWAARLRQLADRCCETRSDLAATYVAWAEQVEAALSRAGAE